MDIADRLRLDFPVGQAGMGGGLADAPVAAMPDSWVDRAALYAGETALRIGELTSAEQAVKELRPR
jgi:hypothetical protein